MTTEPVVNPFDQFTSLAGSFLNAGRVYIGVAGQDPETNPKAVFWDQAMTIPALQPLDVLGGYIMRLGTPARAYTSGSYSIRLRDRFGLQVFYEPTVDPLAAIGGAAVDGSNISAVVWRTALGLGTAAVLDQGTADAQLPNFSQVRNRVRSHNDWPNPDFQVMDGTLEVVKWNSTFTARRPALTISGITSTTLFDTRAQVTFLCANTGELRVDELIRCAAPADVALRQTVVRVQSITPNVSFVGTLEKLSGVPSVLTGFTATVVTRGDDTGAAGGAIGTSGVTKNIDDGASGWPTYQVDDAPASRALFKGCIRYIVWQKKTAGPEYLYHNAAPEDLQHYSNQGRLFGCAVIPKTVGGVCQAFINNSNALVYGSSATTVGSRTWIEVGATISANPSIVREGVVFTGPIGAIFLVAEFISDWGVGPLGDGAYSHRQHTVRTNNTVSPWVAVAFTTPPLADISDSFGFTVDVVQAYNGIVGPNVTTMTGMVEGRSTGPGNKLGFKSQVFGQIQYGTIITARVAANLANPPASAEIDNQWGAIRMKSGRFVCFGLDFGSQAWGTVSFDMAQFEIGTQPS